MYFGVKGTPAFIDNRPFHSHKGDNFFSKCYGITIALHRYVLSIGIVSRVSYVPHRPLVFGGGGGGGGE